VRKIFWIFLIAISLATLSYAQDQPEQLPPSDKKTTENKQPQKKNAKQGASYINFRFGYSGGSIDGFSYNVPTYGIGIESEWGNNHLGLSGHEIEWRKEQFNSTGIGYLLSFQFARILPGPSKHFIAKASGGLEWGVPSEMHDKTSWIYAQNGELQSYTHLYVHRNAWSPFGAHENAILQPLAELRFKSPPVPIELGIRLQYMGFELENYNLVNNTHTHESQYKLVPSFFIRLQIKM